MIDQDVIRRFYEALRKKDVAAIAACYHPDAVFSDPVFTLQGRRVPAMWHMLCEAGKDMEVVYSDVIVGKEGGSGHWDAFYTFSQTGRRVHNSIDSAFRFRKDLIIEHKDSFPFWRWSRMALGTPGLLLGWTPLLRAKIRARALGNLEKFLARHPEYAAGKSGIPASER